MEFTLRIQLSKNVTLNVKNAGSDTTYSWEKSEDGKNWQTVSKREKMYRL